MQPRTRRGEVEYTVEFGRLSLVLSTGEVIAEQVVRVVVGEVSSA